MEKKQKRKAHKNQINKPHISRINNYFKRTGFYNFVLDALKKSLLPIIIAIIGLLLFNQYVFNINDALVKMTETFSSTGVLSFFYISETILGLIPPEIFIGWASKTNEPYFFAVIVATVSYLGGITAYLLGNASLKIKSIKNYLEVKMASSLKNSRKWGGILIVVGALLPLPFAISCLTAGMIRYPFKNVIFYGLFRFLRFAIYTYMIFSVVK